MRYLALSVSLLCGLIGLPSLAKVELTPAGLIVLKAAHIFDAVSGQLAEHAIVVVQADRIIGVGSNAPIPVCAPWAIQ